MSAHDMFKDALVALGVLNLIVSLAVASSAVYTLRQKILQIAVIWVIPVIGAVLLGLFMLTQRGTVGPKRDSLANGENMSQLWDVLNSQNENRH